MNRSKLGTNGDGAESAEEFKRIEVMKNDIIVMATDGLWNNVSDDNLISCIYPFVEQQNDFLDIDLIAEILGEFSKSTESVL
jgi:serine/threonine protein phosphatase PrpC